MLPNTEPDEINLVLGRSDFDSAYSPDGPLKGILQQVFTYKHICFIGCRLSEDPLPELLSRCREIRENFFHSQDEEPPKHHILLSPSEIPGIESVTYLEERCGQPDATEEKMREVEHYYGDMGISVLWYNQVDDDHSGLVAILDDLAGVEPIQLRTGFEDLHNEQR